MPSVKSKYENPDKFIEKLKWRLKMENQSNNLLRTAYADYRGDHAFTYTAPGAKLTVGVEGDDFHGLTPGMRVICHGKVTGIAWGEDSKNIITMRITEVRRKACEI